MVAAAALGSCGKSRTMGYWLEAHATVDGRPVVASTLWRMTVADAFPQGAQVEVHGVALAIPIAPRHFIYGLFRAVNRDGLLASWDVLPGGIDAFVRDEDRKDGRPQFTTRSVSEYHDYATERLLDRSVDICVPAEVALGGQDRCPVFVYFKDASDPSSIQMLRPGEEAVIAGRRVILSRVAAGYREPGAAATSTADDLPDFVRNGHESVSLGRLPPGLETEGARKLYLRDFRRE